jgi:hypothetical protein
MPSLWATANSNGERRAMLLLSYVVPSVRELETWPVLPETSVSPEARRLDRLFPGWHDKIDLDVFKMSSCHHCVLGQLGGGEDGYSGILDMVNYDAVATGTPRVFGAFGSRLDHEWRQEILARRSN